MDLIEFEHNTVHPPLCLTVTAGKSSSLCKWLLLQVEVYQTFFVLGRPRLGFHSSRVDEELWPGLTWTPVYKVCSELIDTAIDQAHPSTSLADQMNTVF